VAPFRLLPLIKDNEIFHKIYLTLIGEICKIVRGYIGRCPVEFGGILYRLIGIAGSFMQQAIGKV
jgi:hypothetical protein